MANFLSAANMPHRFCQLVPAAVLIWLLACPVSQCLGDYLFGESGAPGDDFPDVYYYQDTGLLQVDTDGAGLVALVINTQAQFVHHEQQSPCLLCDGDVIEGQQFAAAYINNSSQWVRIDPIVGSGPLGTIDLSIGLSGLDIDDFPARFEGQDELPTWSVIYASDRDTYSTNVSVVVSGGSAGITLPPASGMEEPQLDPTQSWTNPSDALDVNNDGFVAPQDAMILINDINGLGARPLTGPSLGNYLDTDGDGYLAPIDALRVINAVNAERSPQAPLGFSVTAVPEPSTWVLLLLMLVMTRSVEAVRGTGLLLYCL